MLEMVHLFTFVLPIVREFYEYSSMNWLGSSVNMRECVAVAVTVPVHACSVERFSDYVSYFIRYTSTFSGTLAVYPFQKTAVN